MFTQPLLALSLVTVFSQILPVSAAFHLPNPFYAAGEPPVNDVCKRSDDVENTSPGPFLKLYPRADTTIGTPTVSAQVGPVSAGIGNVNVSIGNVSVSAGNINIQNIAIGNITVIVSVAFNGGSAGPASQTSISSSATSIASSTASATSTISTASTITARAALEGRQETTSTTSDSSSASPSVPSVSVPIPTPTVGPVDVGTGSVSASVGNISISVGNINVTLGDITLKNVTIGNIFVLVQLGDSQPGNNSLIPNLLDAL